jgi:hypothetical protein
MPRTRPSFSILLPLITLALAFAVLSALTTLRYGNFRRVSAHGRAVRIHNHAFDVRFTPDQFLAASVGTAAGMAGRPILAANLPAMSVEAAISGIARSWPESWRPKAFGPTTEGLLLWRALISPIYCLPFWWFAGLGLDAAFARRRLRWPALLLGTVLFGLFAFLAIGLAFTVEHREVQDMGFVFYGFVLWSALWAAFPVAWLRAALQRRKLRTSQHPVADTQAV